MSLVLAMLAGRSAAAVAAPSLDAAAVRRIIGQAAAEAHAVGLPVSIAVVDHEGNVLGTYTMADAPCLTRLHILGPARCQALPKPGTDDCTPKFPPDADCGAEGILAPSLLAAVSKAGTAAFLSTDGNAFTTRTASFIVQQHFPPKVENAPGGPLFGVQFSQLPCSDAIIRTDTRNPTPLDGLFAGTLPLGLSADPGGLPLYVNGHAVGGVGVEGDGTYAADLDPSDGDVTKEDRIAAAATRGFEAPTAIRAERILVGGLRFPFDDIGSVPVVAPTSVDFDPTRDVPPTATPPSRFVPTCLDPKCLDPKCIAKCRAGVRGTVDPRYFPPVDSIEPLAGAGGLTANEVMTILTHGARRADRLRAAIRRPLGDRARVNITVVDRTGDILGIFRTLDAAVFGFDVSVQKARTAVFFSGAAAAQLTAADDGSGLIAGAVASAARDGIALDGATAFSDRAVGFLARPFFPDGIDATRPGPFSRPIAQWSPLNDGLQFDLARAAIAKILSGAPFPTDCTDGRIPTVANGIQIFAGSVPLYRGDVLVGAIGVSGDGIDQDDAVALAGSLGFRAPPAMRADRVRVRGVRLPYVKLPRRPTTR